MKKFVSVLLALMLLISSVVYAESTSNVAYLFDEVRELMFHTDNVTVSLDADFTFDGLKFKEMKLDYKQDGIRSYLSYLLDTRTEEGAAPVRTGYTVLGLGSVAYSNEVRKGNCYVTWPTKVSDTILQNNNKTALALELAKTAAVAAEGTLTVNEKNGNTYNFVSGGFPDFVNKTAYYLIADYIRNNYYIDLFHEAEAYYGYVGIRYEGSWSACVEARFEALYGRAMKENYYEDSMEYGRYQVAENVVSQIETEIRALYNDGYAYIRKDGSYEWYPTLEDCYRAAGEVELHYENDALAFRNFYAMKTGKELSEQDYEIIVNSPSDELWKAVADMSDEMTAYYTSLVHEKDPLAVYADVANDGTITVKHSLGVGKTLTETVIENIAMASLTGMDAGAQTDDNGDILMGWGEVRFDIEYTDGSHHELVIGFSAVAMDRGATSVPSEFIPEDWGLVSMDDFYAAQQEGQDDEGGEDWWEQLVAGAPDTIEFNGAAYPTEYDLYR